jgi:anti-sigma regulatory factor (Ser/Thr protein kinase)
VIQLQDVEAERSWEQPADSPEARDVSWFRHLLRQELTIWDLAWLVEAAELIESELVTNAIRAHAQHVIVRLSATDTVLQITVVDSAPGIVLAKTPDQDAETGRGLQIVDALAAEWGSFRYGTTTVVFANLRI